MGPLNVGKLLNRQRELPMPKMPSRGGSVAVEVEEVAEPEAAHSEQDDDESTKEAIGFTDATMRCGRCENHDGSRCAMYAIPCGPEDGCRIGFEPRGEREAGLTTGTEEPEPTDEMVP